MADKTVDHAEVARATLKEASELAAKEVEPIALAEVQVHATLAVAEELRRLREALGEYLSDDSNLDRIAQALRAIAEPQKYGIDPRGLRS